MRQSGKYGQLLVAASAPTAVTAEAATLNATASTIGGVSYAAYRVASLANGYVMPDAYGTPVTVTVAVGTGSAIPDGLSWVIDYIQGKIIFSAALTSGNTVVVDYYHDAGIVAVADITDWSIDETVKEQDVTAMGDEFEYVIPLQKSWSATVNGHYNLTLWNLAQGATDNAQVTVPAMFVYAKFYTNKNTAVGATNPYFTGCGLLSLSMKAPYNGKVEFSGKLRGTGGLAKIIA